MTWPQTALRLSLRATIAILLAAHILAAYALVAFGWRAGGFALNGTASYAYLALVVGAIVTFILILRRDDDWTQAGLVVLSAAPSLLVVGAWTATSTYGATYAEWGAITGDQLPEQALWHLAFASLGSVLALVLRWPRLLIAWALTHALIFTLGLAVFGHWAYLLQAVNLTGALPLLSPLLYALAGLGLGWRPGKLWHAAALARPPAVPAWVAFAPAALFGRAAALRWLSAQALPQAGEVQAWQNTSQTVPLGAWSPAIVWATRLFAVAPYAVMLVAALGLLSILPELRRARVTPVMMLVGLGLAVLAGVGVSAYTPLFLVPAVVETVPSWLGSAYGVAWPVERQLYVALVGFGLLVAARGWDLGAGGLPLPKPPSAILTLLVLNGLGQLASAWPYARFLFWRDPDWKILRQYAPVAPEQLAWLGLGLHLALLAVTLVVFGQWVGRPAQAAPALVS